MGHVSWFKVASLTPAGGCHDSLVVKISSLSLISEVEEETAADNVQTTCNVDSRFCIVTMCSQVVIQKLRPCVSQVAIAAGTYQISLLVCSFTGLIKRNGQTSEDIK